MLNNIYTIAKNTFRETMRDRILLSALIAILAIILFTLFIGSISLDEDLRIIIDFGITAIYLLQMFVAIFIGSMLMYREIERKTFYLLLPKPIRRSEIILGKVFGLTATTICVTLLSLISLVLILALKDGLEFILPITVSITLSTFEAVLLILLATLFSLVTSPILAAVATISFFFIGHAGDIFRRIFMTIDSTILELIMRFVYYAFPNLEKFNVRNDIIYGIMPSYAQFTIACLYAVTYATFLLFVTLFIFKKKDF